MVGDWVDKYSEQVKKIAEAGHEIANHSDTHPHVNNLSYDQNIAEIQKCTEKIKKITGEETKLYRAPYGEYNDTVITAAEDNRLQSNTMVNRHTRLSRLRRRSNDRKNKQKPKKRKHNFNAQWHRQHS